MGTISVESHWQGFVHGAWFQEEHREHGPNKKHMRLLEVPFMEMSRECHLFPFSFIYFSYFIFQYFSESHRVTKTVIDVIECHKAFAGVALIGMGLVALRTGQGKAMSAMLWY